MFFLLVKEIIGKQGLNLNRQNNNKQSKCSSSNVADAVVWSPEQQAVGAVPLADDGVPAEHQGGRSLLGASKLAEDDPHHARLDHHAHDRLKEKSFSLYSGEQFQRSKQMDPSRLQDISVKSALQHFRKLHQRPPCFLYISPTQEKHFSLLSIFSSEAWEQQILEEFKDEWVVLQQLLFLLFLKVSFSEVLQLVSNMAFSIGWS